MNNDIIKKRSNGGSSWGSFAIAVAVHVVLALLALVYVVRQYVTKDDKASYADVFTSSGGGGGSPNASRVSSEVSIKAPKLAAKVSRIAAKTDNGIAMPSDEHIASLTPKSLDSMASSLASGAFKAGSFGRGGNGTGGGKGDGHGKGEGNGVGDGKGGNTYLPPLPSIKGAKVFKLLGRDIETKSPYLYMDNSTCFYPKTDQKGSELAAIITKAIPRIKVTKADFGTLYGRVTKAGKKPEVQGIETVFIAAGFPKQATADTIIICSDFLDAITISNIPNYTYIRQASPTPNELLQWCVSNHIKVIVFTTCKEPQEEVLALVTATGGYLEHKTKWADWKQPVSDWKQAAIR